MKKISRRTIKKYVFVYVMLGYFLLMFLIFWVFKNINSILLAFQNISFTSEGNVATYDAGLSHFKRFVSEFFSGETIVFIGITNSMKLWFSSFAINFPLGLFFSYFLFRKIWGHQFYRFVIMLPSFVSGFVYCLIFSKMVDGGLISQAWAAITNSSAPSLLRDPNYNFGTILFYGVWLGFSTRVLVYSNAMKEIPDEVLESAKIDGVHTMWQELRFMVLPLVWPTISTFLITGISGMLMASGPLFEFYGIGNAPKNVYTLGFYYYEQLVSSGGNESMYPYMAAGGLILSAVAIVLTYTMRFFCNKLEKRWS